MEHQKISSNFLNESGDSKFVTRKWKNVKDQSNANFNAGNEIIYNTDVLKCNLCDLNDTYIPVRKNVRITRNAASRVAFKKCTPLINDRTTIHGAENIDLIIWMYNLVAGGDADSNNIFLLTKTQFIIIFFY